MTKIAVETSLNNVMDALKNNGYDVVPINESNVSNCECCVISGQDKNVMGIAEVSTKASVINAEGMTADQVVQAVSARVNK